MPVPGVGVGGKPSRELPGRPGVLGRGRKPEDQRPGSRGALRHSPAVSVPGPPDSRPWKRPKSLWVTRGRFCIPIPSPPLPAFLYFIFASIQGFDQTWVSGLIVLSAP